MNAAIQHHLKQYRAHAEKLPGRESPWLRAARAAGLARFEKVGFPGPRDENWRYTSVKPIASKPLQYVAEFGDAADAPPEIPDLPTHRLVFIDGQFAAAHSAANPLPGIRVVSFAEMAAQSPAQIAEFFGAAMPADAHGFAALNSAYSHDGAVVHLPANAKPDKPIELLFISRRANSFCAPRNLIVGGENCQARVIERYVSSGDAHAANGGDHHRLTNSVTEIILAARANLEHYLLQNQTSGDYQVSGIYARQAAASRLRCHSVTLGGGLVRNDLRVELGGEHAHCDMLGLYAIGGRRHADNHTTVAHAAAHCSSRELYKGVLTGRARGVFHGRIQVRPGAQKTDAAQTNNNLLLSRAAEIDTKPQLEIYADDVKCSHGATVGRLDAEALFYLRARGMAAEEARRLLIFAFVDEVIAELSIPELRDWLTARLGEALPAPGANDETCES